MLRLQLNSKNVIIVVILTIIAHRYTEILKQRTISKRQRKGI